MRRDNENNGNMFPDKGDLCNGISRTNVTRKEKDREKAVQNEEKARTKQAVRKTHGKLGGLAKDELWGAVGEETLHQEVWGIPLSILGSSLKESRQKGKNGGQASFS